jgi:fructose-1,6-bisphosphatase/inositol monophosphatase family enzyme
MTRRPPAKHVKRRSGPFPWRQIVQDGLQAANAVVRRLALRAGQKVVAGREAGYRPWDPEVIGVDTAAERAIIGALRRGGVRGTLLSEEAGETTLEGRSARADTAIEPVYVIQDPFDGSLLYRRGIRAHWFTALGIYGQDGKPRAAGAMDHITGEMVLADPVTAVRIARPGARAVPVRPAATTTLDGAFLEAYFMKPPFLYAIATALRPVFERAKFILPNGGPYGFADVACGRIDAYFAWNEALTEVFSAIYIAERAGCVVTHWDGSPVQFRPDIHAVYNVVCSANPRLHKEILQALKAITPPKGLLP